MHIAILIWGVLIGSAFALVSFLQRTKKKLSKKKQECEHHKSRSAFLRKKVFRLLEIEKKHQHNLQVLEKEFEQLHEEVLLKHNINR